MMRAAALLAERSRESNSAFSELRVFATVELIHTMTSPPVNTVSVDGESQEVGSDRTNDSRSVPDLCVICLERSYAVVFLR